MACAMERVYRQQILTSPAELVAILADPASEFCRLAIFVLELRLIQRQHYW